MRRRVEGIAGIRIVPGCRVLELVTTTDRKEVSGVRVQHEGRTDTRSADLVIDASGSGDSTLAALRATGHEAPAETTIGVNVGYSTATFAIPDDAPPHWKGLMHLPKAPEAARGALMFPVEGARWMVALAGREGDYPPGDEAGFRLFTEGLRTPTLTNALRSARLVDKVDRFRFPESRLRHFDRLAAFPRGLLPIGDAICRFNPIFGQGMSVAALEARALGQALEASAASDGSLDAARRAFFARVVEIVDTPWALAAVPDLIYPSTVGARPPDFEMSLRFGVALTKATAQHPDIHKVAAEVQQLLRPRAALMAPGIVERVMAAMG